MLWRPSPRRTQFDEAGGAYYLRTELIPDLVSGLFGVYPLTGALKKVAMPSHRKLRHASLRRSLAGGRTSAVRLGSTRDADQRRNNRRRDVRKSDPGSVQTKEFERLLHADPDRLNQ